MESLSQKEWGDTQLYKHVNEGVRPSALWSGCKANAEDILIPVAMRLAQTFVQAERKPEAVRLLQALWGGEPPFMYGTIWDGEPPPPTLFPLGNQLMGLLGQEDRHFSSLQKSTAGMKREFRDLPVVKIGQQNFYEVEDLT
ncbi:predicted protein [Histoplasma mississippiense (nom. inval.)]|uniref:predicted protein n=1 Tax=Ajellomyces capsulatus (strain NAm1 / WU24) TaxID=2059318 RepID=UPI000157BC5C|nr:predicted protein [Histoplasma mississippiense (nom. inval.)]EDN06087.1 predicted protein [Histoplasma mississippiense (nom. inval.)]